MKKMKSKAKISRHPLGGLLGWWNLKLGFHARAALAKIGKMPFTQWLLQQSQRFQGSKNTIVSPIGWAMMGILVILVAAIKYQAAPEILVVLMLLTVVFAGAVSLGLFLFRTKRP